MSGFTVDAGTLVAGAFAPLVTRAFAGNALEEVLGLLEGDFPAVLTLAVALGRAFAGAPADRVTSLAERDAAVAELALEVGVGRSAGGFALGGRVLATEGGTKAVDALRRFRDVV